MPTDSRLHVSVTRQRINPDDVLGHLRTDSAGGHCIFLGTTRDNADNRRVVTLFYEAYEGMAVREASRLVEEALRKWKIERCVVIHRLGEVPVGETSVAIGVSAAHRGEAFEACRFLIDELKRWVPIWKREHFADGGQTWVEGTGPTRSLKDE